MECEVLNIYLGFEVLNYLRKWLMIMAHYID